LAISGSPKSDACSGMSEEPILTVGAQHHQGLLTMGAQHHQGLLTVGAQHHQGLLTVGAQHHQGLNPGSRPLQPPALTTLLCHSSKRFTW